MQSKKVFPARENPLPACLLALMLALALNLKKKKKRKKTGKENELDKIITS